MGAPVWKGRLSYGNRSVAVKILTGARSENPSFNQLHRHDSSRVKQVLFCAKEDKAIARSELVKGFEYADGEFIVLEEEEIKGLAPPAPEVIDLRFVPLEQVDPVCFESSYYVVPGAEEPPYAALFGALRRTSLAGIAVVTLYSRERPLLFRAGESGIVAHALFHSHETRHLDQFRTSEEAASEAELAAAARVLKGLARDFDYQDYPDLQAHRTEALIAAKMPRKAAGAQSLPESAKGRSRNAART